MDSHYGLPLTRLLPFYTKLSPGDRFIATLLGLLVIGTSLAGLIALQRSFLVTVPAKGGSLTEGIVGSPRFVNPLLALTDADRDLTALTYAGLMGTDGEGNLVPVLAERYRVSEDGQEYTFSLREDAKFSDGTPVTAEDVVFTVEKAQDPALRSPELANWANIRAEALDARTVVFTLPKPYAPFLVDTTLGILPADKWRNVPVDEFSFSPLMTNPIGAGPFKVARVSRDKDGSVTGYELRASDTYVLGRPYLDVIYVKFYDDVTKLADAYERKSIQSAYGIPVKDALRSPYSRVFGAFFNSDENPVFARLEVREALSLAIDRNRIVTEVLGGYATPLTGPVPPGSGVEAYELPEGDGVELAIEILEDEGWTRNEETGGWENEDESLSLPQVTLKTSNVPELKAIAASIETDWERLGVPTEVALYEPGDLAATVIRPRAYEALLFGMVIGRDRDLFAFWDSGERSDPGLNIAAYANRTVDLLLERIREEQDPEVARKDLAKVSKLIASDYPAAFTHAPDFLYAIPNSVRGVRLPQIASPSDRFATVSTWYRNTEEVWPIFAGK
ncbi:MAG: peptide/nickel transport system substrate-binding protein [Patescibacteria group bacterium]|jgi:peptide/nickel transport system substrate-binding protein|nr:peptide/nickel transport system substrate-binding protein [Patescibacteria group bacterium]